MIESIKKAFVLSAKAVKLFYVLVAVGIIGSSINFLIVLTLPHTARMDMVSFLPIIGFVILFSLIGIFIQGGAFAYVKELIKTGSASLASFVSNGKKYFLRLLCISLIFLLLFAILVFSAMFFIHMISNLKITGLSIAAIVFLVIFYVLLFIVFTVLFIMPGYALVGSDLDIIESLKKGILLGLKNFFKLLGILIILFIVGIAMGLLTSAIGMISDLISRILMAVLNAAVTVLINIAFMDFYLKSITGESPQL